MHGCGPDEPRPDEEQCENKGLTTGSSCELGGLKTGCAVIAILRRIPHDYKL